MKLSTLANRVAKHIEDKPRNWRRRYMKRNDRYCALGLAAREISLSSKLHEGQIDPAEFGDLNPADQKKVTQLKKFEETFYTFATEICLPWTSVMDLNDDTQNTSKIVARVLRQYARWLKTKKM